MDIQCNPFTLSILDEPTYSAGSADNVRAYRHHLDFTNGYRASSRHGLICRESDENEHSIILLTSGGATRVHPHSVVVVKRACCVAVGDMICSLELPTLNLNWATKVDDATCFGVYHSPEHDCLLSHGELQIARLRMSGEIDWSRSGADIFSEGFRIDGDDVEAIDFNGKIYRFEIATGQHVSI